MTLTSPRLFFDSVKAGVLGPALDQQEVDGCNAILDAMNGAPLAWTAYALATAYLETGHTMQPVREANWLSLAAAERYFERMYDIAGNRPAIAKALGNTCAGDGVLFCGRGYVQLTGRTNYARAKAKLGVDLVAHPDKALECDVAAKIMRQGMTEGWFTGKRFADYLPGSGPATREQFRNARRIINGQDRAADIAGFALQFQTALAAGGCMAEKKAWVSITWPRITDHIGEIWLLGIVAIGVMILMGIGLAHATEKSPFDPSAYLVVLTLIVGAIKERWTQRSVDRMGASLANSPPAEPPASEPATG